MKKAANCMSLAAFVMRYGGNQEYEWQR